MKLYVHEDGTMEWVSKNKRFFIGFDDKIPYWGYIDKDGDSESDYFTRDQWKHMEKELEKFV